MVCDRCGTSVEKGDEREHYGQTLCEDCYMDALSPTRACDPWAVHSAKALEKTSGSTLQVSATQAKILAFLEESGGAEPGLIVERLNISTAELEREIAALRHMEKVRAELREGRKVLRLW